MTAELTMFERIDESASLLSGRKMGGVCYLCAVAAAVVVVAEEEGALTVVVTVVAAVRGGLLGTSSYSTRDKLFLYSIVKLNADNSVEGAISISPHLSTDNLHDTHHNRCNQSFNRS